MLFWENIRLALTSLKSNKMRSLLTMLGIIIGISSVIAIVTVGNSLTATLSDSMLSLGANNITVYLDRKEIKDETTEEGYVFQNTDGVQEVLDEDLITNDMIMEYKEKFPDEVYAVSATNDVLSNGVSSVGKKSAAVNLKGVSAGFFVEKSTKILAGRLFTAKEMLEGRKLALVSEKYVEKIYPSNEDAIGQDIVISGNGKDYTFTIAGVYEKSDSDMGMALLVGSFNSASDVYIPLKTAQDITHQKNYTNVSVVLKSGINPNEFAKETEKFFAGYYRTHRSFTVHAMSLASVTEQLENVMNKLTLGISVIAGIALLVGGIGVMNIMLVSITERTREIGTRKALGAPNSSIRTQFIVEAVVICLIGGLIGVMGGIGLGALAVKLMKGVATPSVSSIVVSLLFSMAIGVFFGYYPANKAAKMDPIEALRYE